MITERPSVALLCLLNLRRTSIIVARLLCVDHRATVRDLYDPRFVDDAGASTALLHDANDPSLLPIAHPSILPHCSRQTHTTGFHLCAKPGCLLPWQADQQATWETQEKELVEISTDQDCSFSGIDKWFIWLIINVNTIKNLWRTLNTMCIYFY